MKYFVKKFYIQTYWVRAQRGCTNTVLQLLVVLYCEGVRETELEGRRNAKWAP